MLRGAKLLLLMSYSILLLCSDEILTFIIVLLILCSVITIYIPLQKNNKMSLRNMTKGILKYDFYHGKEVLRLNMTTAKPQLEFGVNSISHHQEILPSFFFPSLQQSHCRTHPVL
jgi:hypothetical protein